ncbi:MAG: flagellar M-ring protein FliF, partial [Gammaproteobacteria bacterium]|nr:flagellar M-ring protein FliF [Gammaproteobacteria bacterium]
MDLVNNETGDVSEEPGQEVDRLTPQTLMENPVVKQLGVMIGIAASVAIGVAVVLWSQSPSYSMLFGNLSPKDAPEVISALQQAGIEYEVDQKTGVVMVPSAKLQDARMKMAAQGLPHTNSIGFELLQQETGFGTSRALEAARFHRALEGELARTISTLANIEKARVHLATPKQSVFVRKRKKPSASVVVKLYPGRVLDKSQIAAITHLVASSVPELESDRITIVDNRGELLSNQLDKGDMLLTATQFDYTKRFEEDLRQRVVNILTPILGEESVRAQVTAELDFTRTEQTAERYNPDPRSVRSEQVNEQASRLSPVQGVPGALSNQPPAAGIAPEEANGGENGEGGGSPLNTTKRAVRNYELDKTISHTQLSTGALRRLSVAVVVDDAIVPVVKSTADTEAGAEEEEEEEGQVQFTRVQRSPEDINRITELVKEAIGFNASRGDSGRAINAAFMAPTQMEPLPSP